MAPVVTVARSSAQSRLQSLLPLDVYGPDLLVPLVTGGLVRHANLDCAASPPCLRAAHEAVASALPWYGSVNRGAGYASAVSTRLLERARAGIGAFVGARQDDSVILTRHTTDALNLLAACLPSGSGVVTFASEHHANLLPWRA
ncbi:MAG TPA: aminotransferase class V-fold PLP-dependent enzyme, partial [Myxococcales bacterium]|nr:aminotransferase class V-fold PLP-dependent enzyme [Myxococcales bacterium]